MSKRNWILILFFLICMVFNAGCAKLFSLEQKTPEEAAHLPAQAVLIDSESIRTETINLINNANRAIFIQLSALDDTEIIRLLVNKSREDVEVRILLDQWQRENTNTVKDLKNQNVSIQYYPAQKGQYQRVRYIVADYENAIYYSQDWTKKGFDTHHLAVMLNGQSAWSITKSFVRDWVYTTTLDLEIPAEKTFKPDQIQFSVNTGVKQQVVRLITTATSEIKLFLEQVDEPDTVKALIDAKKRGCNVSIILSPSSEIATPNTLKRLKEANIDIRYYNHPNKLAMGYNAGIFDNKYFILTSSSWTYYSFIINHESALTIPSPEVIERINDLFQQENTYSLKTSS